MKQKILDLLPRAGALLVVISILLCCVVPARAASTSEAVQYYDILDFDMFGTLTGGATAKETFDVADYMSLYGESYSYSSWSLLITGEFDGTKLVTSYGATLYSSTACSYQFTLSKDWLKDPSIKVQQENTGVTGRYRITGAYLINSTYVSKHVAYFWEEVTGFSFSSVYNNLYNFSPVPSDYIVPSSLAKSTLIFTPRVIIPCTTLYFELGFDYLIPEDLNISVVSCSSSGTITEIHDYEMTLLSSSGYFYQYGIEVTGPFTDFVFVCVDYSLDAGAEIYFNGFYAGYNRILNTNSLLEQIREQTTSIRATLSKMRTRLDEIGTNLAEILERIANGELGSKPATNIFDSWNSTITGLSGNFQSVVDAVEGIAGDITSGLSSSINSISNAVDGIAGSVTSGLSSSINSISTAVDGIAGSVSDALASSFDSLTTATSSIAGDIIDGLPDIVGELSDIPGKIKDVFSMPDFSFGFDFDSFNDALDNAGSAGDEYLDIFESEIGDVHDQVSSGLGASAAESEAGLGAAFVFVGNYVNLIWDGIPDHFVIVFVIPIFLGILFYILSHFRIPETKPLPDQYTVSETWTRSESVSVKSGNERFTDTHTTVTRKNW